MSHELDEDLVSSRGEIPPLVKPLKPLGKKVNHSSDKYQQKRLGNMPPRSVTHLSQNPSVTSITSGAVPPKLPKPPKAQDRAQPVRGPVHEHLEESRKANIVKRIVMNRRRKASVPEDEFEPNPELSSSMSRPQGE